jgi:predicted N-acetyltransferase YhbS
MSLLHQTDVYQGSNEKADRKHSGYGFVLALVCVALALVVASVMFTPAPVGSGIDDEILFVGP